MLDWDAVVEYDGERIACGDFGPIFGREEIEEGDETCTDMKSDYSDLCCYTPPIVPCNLCQTESDFLLLGSKYHRISQLWGQSWLYRLSERQTSCEVKGVWGIKRAGGEASFKVASIDSSSWYFNDSYLDSLALDLP